MPVAADLHGSRDRVFCHARVSPLARHGGWFREQKLTWTCARIGRLQIGCYGSDGYCDFDTKHYKTTYCVYSMNVGVKMSKCSAPSFILALFDPTSFCISDPPSVSC